MTDVTVEYPETRELIGGEVCPRGTMAKLAAAEAVCEVIKTFRDNGEFFDPDTCRALDEWQKARGEE